MLITCPNTFFSIHVFKTFMSKKNNFCMFFCRTKVRSRELPSLYKCNYLINSATSFLTNS